MDTGSSKPPITIRLAEPADTDRLWEILEPIVRGGEVYAWPRDMTREAGLATWSSPGAEVYVAEYEDEVVGTAFLKPNQLGGGAHVANAGYATATESRNRGVARGLCAFTLERAKELGFEAIQFNFVVSTNTKAVRLWQSLGFETVGVLPGAYNHPSAGMVDVFVMFRRL